jgi:DNA invertase Pin-like site-specific DNA recombinase
MVMNNSETIAYTRISCKKLSIYNGASLEVQKHKCQEYCDNNGLVLKEVIQDIGTGTNINALPGMKKLINLAKRRKFKRLIFYDASRFARNISQAISVLDKLQSYGITIHSILDNVDYNIYAGKYQLINALNSAERESKILSAKVTGSVTIRRIQGHVFGNPEYGYEAYKKNGIRKFRKNEFEQSIIQYVVLQRNKFKSINDIVQELNSDKKILKRGKLWNSNILNRLINIHKKSTVSNTSNNLSKITLDNHSKPNNKKRKFTRYNLR